MSNSKKLDLDTRILYSICICNYNMADTIEQSLESLLRQIDDNVEVVIADDGSTDGSVSIINKMSARYPSIRLIELKRDPKRKLGFTRNISIENARGEYVLLHIDCDDVFGPHIMDFIQVFHKLEGCYQKDILVSGEHINMARRDFLLSYGPYRNIYRGEDRDLWIRMAADEAYVRLDHIDFVTRLPKTVKKRFFKTIKDTWDHMKNDFRSGVSLWKYYGYEYGKRREMSFKYLVLRLFMLLPVCIAAKFEEPIRMTEGMETPEKFARYRDRHRGTFFEVMARRGCNSDLLFLTPKAQEIFSVKNRKEYRPPHRGI